MEPSERRTEYRSHEWDRIDPIFQKWRKRLNLLHWNVSVEIESLVAGRDDAAASIRVAGAFGDIATLALTDDLVYSDNQRQLGRCIVHELVHLKTNEMADYAQRYMTPEQYDWWNRLYEQSVDQLARCFVEMEEELCNTPTDAESVDGSPSSISECETPIPLDVPAVDPSISDVITGTILEDSVTMQVDSGGCSGCGTPIPPTATSEGENHGSSEERRPEEGRHEGNEEQLRPEKVPCCQQGTSQERDQAAGQGQRSEQKRRS